MVFFRVHSGISSSHRSNVHKIPLKQEYVLPIPVSFYSVYCLYRNMLVHPLLSFHLTNVCHLKLSLVNISAIHFGVWKYDLGLRRTEYTLFDINQWPSLYFTVKWNFLCL